MQRKRISNIQRRISGMLGEEAAALKGDETTKQQHA